MFRVNNFDKLLDKATSNLRLDPDWPTILQICDLIRQNDCSPKYAVAAIKKKLYSQNPHQAMFALLTMESVVKNCGSGIHDEVTSKAFCEMLRDLVKTTQHENLRTKILELIQAWAFAFRNSPKYRSVQDTVNILKAEGYKFPTLKESDAMFSADTAPEWADGEVCHRCRVAFSLIVRRHHCRACGQVFCQQCSSKTSTLPKFGIEKEVRVCDACYDKVSRPPPSGVNINKLEIVDTSNDYGPTQPQKRTGGKTAEELQEEEELQLALALSQSEAEQKEKERKPRSYIAPDPTPHHPTVSPTPSSVSASPEHSTQANTELSRYLDRNYWEQRLTRDNNVAPTAPAPASHASDTTEEFPKASTAQAQDDDAEDKEIDDFVEHLKSQVEIFVNRMKSNSSRGRSIANDTAVQTLFMNITAMHSRLLRLIQQQDDKRVYLESLQDKVTQIRDSRAALDTLRAEHVARAAAAAEAAERQRQLQMATKLQAMRKKKHEYLQYQRQLALQRVQEQEREMQMRQEQQKHQYMMSSNNFYVPTVSMPQFMPTPYSNQQQMYNQFHPQMMPQSTSENTTTLPGPGQMSTPNIPMNLSQGISMQQPNYALSTTAGSVNIPASTQQTMNQQSLRANISQQLPLQQQMLLQQMHQLRMSQPVMQLGANIPQQNGQNIPKQMPQPNNQPPNSMMPLLVGQQNVAQAMMNANNAMLGLQMQNMRVHPMQGNQTNSNQIPVSGYASMTLPNQPTQAGAQPQSLHQSQMNAPGQQIPLQGQSLPGQQLHGQPLPGQALPGQQLPGQALPGQQLPGQALPGQQLPGQALPGQQLPGQSLPGQPHQLQMNNNMQPNNQPGQPQVPQTQGQQMPQNLHHQQMSHVQMPGQGMPGQQMMMQGQQTQNIPQQVHQMNPALAQGQLPPGQAQQINQGQQIQGQQINQVKQTNQGQQMNQGSLPPPQLNQQVPQNLPPGTNQQMQMGQPMQMGPMTQQLPQGAMNMQQMPQMQQMNPPQMQQLPPGQTPSQNIQGQPMKMQQQQNFNNGPQGPPPNNQQPQTAVKSEHNNNTAELISFD